MLLPGCTVGGVHVDYSFFLSQSPSSQPVNTEEAVIWGLIAGGYSVPGGPFGNQPPEPLAQPHEDWMWWECTPFSPLPSGSGQATTSIGRGSGPLMVKSRRKLDELGDDIFLVAQVDPTVIPPGVTSMEITVTFKTSTLLLLP